MPIPYFDYAATTPVDPEILPELLAVMGPDGDFANPSASLHGAGQAAAVRVESARAQVAALLQAKPRELIFTSGATESNNLAILGLAARHPGGHLVTSAIEHDAVLGPCEHLEAHGWRVTRVAPEGNGQVPPAAIAAALQPDTFLVSLMHANNETGVINDIAAVAALCRTRGIAFHVDAAQSAGLLPLDLARVPVDLLSLSAHKLYGPKGAGILFLRRRPDLELEPLMFGGGQERGHRPGTLAVHQVLGTGLACALAAAKRESDTARIAGLRDRLQHAALELDGVTVNGLNAPRLPGHLNLSVEGVRGEVLLQALAARMAISAGSACHAATMIASHVLAAMGIRPELAQASLRFSLGRFTIPAEIDFASEVFVHTVRRLRA